MENMKTLLRWSLKFLASLLLLIIVGLSVLIIFEIPVELTRFKQPIEVLVSKSLDRPVQVKESIVISTSLNPYLTIKGLVIENPQGFEGDYFLSVDLAKIQLDLLPLLQMKVDVSQIMVEGFDLLLEETGTGKVNWVFNSDQGTGEVEAPQPTPPIEASKDGKSFTLRGDTLVVRKLELRDIKVNYSRPDQEKPAHVELKTCTGSMLSGKPLLLDIDGTLADHDYTIDVSVGSLKEMLEGKVSWVKIKANIAETKLNFSGNVNLATASKSLVLKTSVLGENLADLDHLFKVNLPPFSQYKLDTELHLQPRQMVLQSLVVQTGSSSLAGSGKFLKNKDKTTLDIQLRSPLVQLDDFVFDEWSWKEAESTESEENIVPQKEEDTTEAETAKAGYKEILDPELLVKYEGLIEIEAEKVLSGEDELGNGLLQVSLKEGRIKVEPLTIGLPAGKIEIKASLKPGTVKSDAELQASIENFDIGVLVRRSKPESEMGGFVNLDMHLQASASSIDDLMATGNGYLDFSGDLENFSAGIIDLWAVNLVATILSNGTKDKSELNCAVGRWSVIDGFLRSDAFFIDTSKIRICADGEVDLSANQIDVKVRPRAKRPEFFNLSTPLELHGSFSDINVGVQDGAIIGSVIRFLASPVSVPLKRTFAQKIPRDGSDVCNMTLGPQGREEISVPMCQD